METIKDSENRPKKVPSQERDFLCRKDKLCQVSTCFKSMFFKGTLPSAANLARGSFAETDQRTVSLEDTHVMSMEIWFHAIHESELDKQSTAALPLSIMWHVANEGDKYDLDISLLKRWFWSWFSQHDIPFEDFKMLLFPCWIFDHAAQLIALPRPWHTGLQATFMRKILQNSTDYISQLVS